MRAHFTQVTQGTQREGNIYVVRPGKMRVVYLNPKNFLVVANGSMIAYVNLVDKNATYLPVSTSPAQFLLRPSIKIGSDIDVKNAYQEGRMGHAVFSFKSSETGLIDLVFKLHPFQLDHWVVTMPDQKSISVFLSQLQTNIPLDDSLFAFKGSWQSWHKRS